MSRVAVVAAWGYRGAMASGNLVMVPRDLLKDLEAQLMEQTGVRDNHVTYKLEYGSGAMYFTFSDFTCYIGTEVRGFDFELKSPVWEE
jgi:hypothetical protein